MFVCVRARACVRVHVIHVRMGFETHRCIFNRVFKIIFIAPGLIFMGCKVTFFSFGEPVCLLLGWGVDGK